MWISWVKVCMQYTYCRYYKVKGVNNKRGDKKTVLMSWVKVGMQYTYCSYYKVKGVNNKRGDKKTVWMSWGKFFRVIPEFSILRLTL